MSFSRIRLELDYLELNRPKERWNIYFVIATELPDDPDKLAVRIVPDESVIPLRGPADNKLDLTPEGSDEGLFVLERIMPQYRSVKARLWVMHSRDSARNTGEILSEIRDMMGNGNTIAKVVTILGGGSPWIIASKAAIQGIGMVGEALKKINDRQLGFVNMDEHFGPEFDEDPEQDRSNNLSTGFGKIGWTWVVYSD